MVVVSRVFDDVWRCFPLLTCGVDVSVGAGCALRDVLLFAVGLRLGFVLVQVCCIGCDSCCSLVWRMVGELACHDIECLDFPFAMVVVVELGLVVAVVH